MATFTSDSYEGRYLQLTITESVNVIANTSTLTWTLTSAGGSSSYYTVDATTVTINGTQVYYKARTDWDDRVFPAAKGSVSGTLTVSHNSDGTKSVAVGFSTRVYVYGPLEYGGTMTLTSIDRTAPTVSCSVANITANGFKITANSSAAADIWQYSLNGGSSWTQFSTTAGTSASVTLSSLSANTTYSVRTRARKRSNQVYGASGTVSAKTLGGAILNSCGTVTADAATVSLTLNATVYNASYSNYVTIKNGSTVYVSFAARTWPTGTANRTITLSQTERADLLEAMASLKSFTATIELVTKSGGTQIGNTSTCTCTIQTIAANSAPTMTAFTFRDGRSATSAVTGNNQLFIQTYSYLYVTPGTAAARNGATIVKYAATCNGKTYSNTTGAELNLYGIEKSGTLDVVVTATDSRGYTVSNTQRITVIPYSKPKVSEISLRRTNDIEAEMQLIFNGSISPITVGGVQKNSLLYVQYRYKLTSASSYGSYTTITSSVTKSGTSFSYSNLELCSLDANSSYDFHLYICDKLNTLSAVNLYFTVPQGTPLVALRKKKVGINTPAPEAALHVVGDAKITGAVNVGGALSAASLSGTLPVSNVSGTLPISKGGTGSTTAAAAITNIINGRTVAPLNINVTGNRYWIDGVYGINMQNSDIIGINGLYFLDAVDSQGEGINFYRSSTTWDRLYSYAGTLYYSPNVATNTHPGTRYTVYHSGGATIPISKGGTGATYAASARTNLGITCTSLYSGTLSSGSTTFNYGNYNFYIILAKPGSGVSSCAIVIPKAALTTSTVKYQVADETYYLTFGLSYSGSTVTLTWSSSNGSGVVNKVYGVN